MKVGILAITEGGKRLAGNLAQKLLDAVIINTENGILNAMRDHWHNFDGFICIMAAGIVVRAIADLIDDKRRDPCVVVVDELGNYSISLLSGHLGGGNDLAKKIAAVTGGQAVITTASDTLKLPSLDLWAAANGLVPLEPEMLTKVSAVLVNEKKLHIFSEVEAHALPAPFTFVESPGEADLIISSRLVRPRDIIQFCPRNLVVGIGCNRGVTEAEIEAAFRELFESANLAKQSVRNLASIDLKSDEQGLLKFAANNKLRIEFFGKNDLNSVKGVTPSQAVLNATGAIGVAEPAAMLSAQQKELLIRKHKWRNVTMAVAKANFILSAQDRGQPGI